jgi:hypothetical protein
VERRAKVAGPANQQTILIGKLFLMLTWDAFEKQGELPVWNM